MKSYIFLDESGKPEVYSKKGKNLVELRVATRFLVISAICTSDQLIIQQQITDFKLSLLNDSSLKDLFSSTYTLDSFHAHNDYPIIREKFYHFITTMDIKIDVIVVEKLKCHYSLQHAPGKLYGIMAGQLLKNICHQTEDTEILFSRKDSKLKLRQELEAEVERVRLEHLEKKYVNSTFTLTYYHNPHYTHGGLQIADYISYAIFQVYEKQNDIYYRIIQDKISGIYDICNKKYFTRSNPLKLS